MNYDRLEKAIRVDSKGEPSESDQIQLAIWLHRNRYTIRTERWIRTRQTAEEASHILNHDARTVLDNLAEDDYVVQQKPSGSGNFIQHQRSGKAFFDPNDPKIPPLIEEEMSRLLEDLRSSDSTRAEAIPDGSGQRKETNPQTVRDVASQVLEVSPPKIEEELTEPDDLFEQMNKLDNVVAAIKTTDDVSRGGDYDEMGWRRTAIRWTLSRKATAMVEDNSLS